MSIATYSSSTGTSSPRGGDWRQCKSIGERNLHIFQHRKDLMDVKFLLGADKQEIMAHSCILVLQSAEFERILPPTRDKNEPIELPQYDPKSFELLLQATYLGELPETDGVEIDFIELLKLARTFKPDLEAVCKFRVARGINDWKMALKALELEDLAIKQSALKIICGNSDEVLKSVEFLNILLNSLKEILKLDELEVGESGETKIFQALIRWAENKSCRSENGSLSKEDRGKLIKKEIGDIIHLIRFPLMPQKDFLEEVAPLKILSDEETAKISMCKFCLSYSKDCDHSREKPCDPSPFSCKPRRNNSERTISSLTHSEEPASIAERPRAAIPVDEVEPIQIAAIAVIDMEVSRAAIPIPIPVIDGEVEPMQIPKVERRRNASRESVEGPRRKILKVSGNEGLSIARHIEDNSVAAPIQEDANSVTIEATSENALMDHDHQEEASLQPTTSTSRGSEGNQEGDSMIEIPSSSMHPMTAIKVTPGMKTFIKGNSWIDLQTESPEETIPAEIIQHGNFMFLDHGFTRNVYTIQSTPTNELLKLKYGIVADRNDLSCLSDIWHPPVDSVNQVSPILISLQGTKLNAYDLQNGQKVVAEMDLTFPGGDIEYGNLEIVGEFICVEHFFNDSESESDEDESTPNGWADKEMVQELLILELKHSPIRVELRYKIIIPKEALGKDFKSIKREKMKLFVQTGRKVEIYDIWDLKDKGARKILKGEEHDAATFSKHPQLKTVTIQQMPNPQHQFDDTDGLEAIVSKTGPMHVIACDDENYSIYNVEHPEKPIRTISGCKGKGKAANEKIIEASFCGGSTVPYVMFHYENGGFILIRADEPGGITNSVLTTSHIFPMKKKSGKRKKCWTRVDPAKKEMRWPNWIFERSKEHKGKIGICSIDTDNKIIHVSIHDTKDLTKNIQKLPPLKIEEWGIPEESVKEMDIDLCLNDNFVRVLYGKYEQNSWQHFIYCRMRDDRR